MPSVLNSCPVAGLLLLRRWTRPWHACVLLGCLLLSGHVAALVPTPYGENFVRVGESWPDGRLLAGWVGSDQVSLDDNEKNLQQELLSHEQAHGPYGDALAEPLASLGRQYSQQGDHLQAQRMYRRALHVVRVNDGLYSERQLPILKQLLDTYRATGDLEALDGRYEYYFRLHGSGKPPFTELRLKADIEYLRWQREALRLGAHKNDKAHSRLLSLYSLNQQLLEAVAADENVAFVYYRELGLSQLRNLYLIQNRLEPELQTVSEPPDTPIAGANWRPEDIGKMRMKGIYRSAYRSGQKILEALIRRCPPDDPETLARLFLELADWKQWNGRAQEAVEGYSRLVELLQQEERQDLLQLWLAQPVELPDNGAFWQPMPMQQAALRHRVLEASYDVSSGGRASNVAVTAVDSADEKLVSKLVRQIRRIRFRPRFVDGEAAPDQLVRSYQLVR